MQLMVSMRGVVLLDKMRERSELFANFEDNNENVDPEKESCAKKKKNSNFVFKKKTISGRSHTKCKVQT